MTAESPSLKDIPAWPFDFDAVSAGLKVTLVYRDDKGGWCVVVPDWAYMDGGTCVSAWRPGRPMQANHRPLAEFLKEVEAYCGILPIVADK